MVSEPEEIWEPMATAAPLDGTPVRLRKDDIVATASWSTEMRVGIRHCHEPNCQSAFCPWHPKSWAPVRGALE